MSQPGEVSAGQSDLPSHSDNPEINLIYAKGLQQLLKGDYPQAESLFRKALDEDPSFTWARVKLADALYRQYRLDEANNLISDILKENSQPYIQLEARQVHSNILYAQGQLEASMRESGELIGLARDLGHRLLEASQWMNLGTSAQSSGDEKTAFESLDRSLRLYREIGYQPGVGNALYNLANVHNGLAQWEAAYSLYEQAELAFERCGQNNHRAQARFEMAQVLRSMGHDTEKIRQTLIETGRIFEQTGDVEGQILVEIELIRCDLDEGRYEPSISPLQALIRRSRNQNLAYPLFLARHHLIRTWLNLHRPDQAALLLDEDQEFNPSDPMFSLLKAHCAYERMDFAQAEKIALDVRREHADTWEQQHQTLLEHYRRARQTGLWTEMII